MLIFFKATKNYLKKPFILMSFARGEATSKYDFGTNCCFISLLKICAPFIADFIAVLCIKMIHGNA